MRLVPKWFSRIEIISHVLITYRKFLFLQIPFRADWYKNLFSKEDNEKVTGEYLNMKFADDLLGKSFAGMMVLTCMGLSRIEVALSRRSLM